MVTTTNLSDLELDGRGIQSREIDSGQAADGDVLTADGAGGAAWAAPAGGDGGGGLATGVLWLGTLGTENVLVMNGELTAAYTAATGEAPGNGALVAFHCAFNGWPQVVVYWADQGMWRGLMDAGFFS